MTWIQTYTGKRFDFIDPRPESIDIVDIAHALALQCRFNGHCKPFYSVAQHCWLMASRGPQDVALESLMHDAAEAYLGDCVRPLKSLLTQWKVIEKRVESAIADKFGLQYPWPASVQLWDEIMLATEARDVLGGPVEGWSPLPEPLRQPITPWDARYSETRFLHLFEVLAKKREEATAG